MKVKLTVLRWLVAAAAAIGVLGAFAATALADTPATAAGLAWSNPIPYGPTVNPSAGGALTELVSMSCATPGNCVAVGKLVSTTTTGIAVSAVVAVQSGGTWGSPMRLVNFPSDAATGQDAGSSLESVACTSATSCIAVGDYLTAVGGDAAMVVPLAISGAASTAAPAVAVTLPADKAGNQNARLNGVACSPSGACTAVGYYVDTTSTLRAMTAVAGDAGAWVATQVTPPSAADGQIQLNAISCPASGACEAVGSYAHSNNLHPWAVTVTDGTATSPADVSLPVDFTPRPGDGGSSTSPNTDQGLMTISCPSAGACVAAGLYPVPGGSPVLATFGVAITSGSPGAGVRLSSSTFPDTRAAMVAGISCVDAGDCLLITGVEANPGTSFVNRLTGGSWSEPVPVPVGGVQSVILGFACVGFGRCEFADIYSPDGATLGDAFTYSAPLVVLNASVLPAATVGVPYSATLSASGGGGAYSWSATPGSLPAGLALDASTGTISGTPTTAGSDTLTATATDPGPPAQTQSESLPITVSPPPRPARRPRLPDLRLGSPIRRSPSPRSSSC